jgi:hypothetical protein
MSDWTISRFVFERADGFGRRKCVLMKEESGNHDYGWIACILLMRMHSIESRSRSDSHWEDNVGLDDQSVCI